MMKSCVVITPTIGSINLSQCIHSVQDQTYPTKHLIVVDGYKYLNAAEEQIDKTAKKLPEIVKLKTNVGSGGWYGHRVYAAFSLLVEEDYIIYLDEDNWLEPNHVEELINLIENSKKEIGKSIQWSFSLRNINSKEGEFICRDDCESLGEYASAHGFANHIDTSCFCIPKEIATKVSIAWFGKYGQDRIFYNTLKNYFPYYDTPGKYTLNYRLGGNPGSPKKEFFINGNEITKKAYGKFPWNKED